MNALLLLYKPYGVKLVYEKMQIPCSSFISRFQNYLTEIENYEFEFQ